MIKNLGILYKDNEIVNHRSLIKVLLNPILRKFGYDIASSFRENKFEKYVLRKTVPINKISFKNINQHNEFDKIIKIRTII